MTFDIGIGEINPPEKVYNHIMYQVKKDLKR